MPGNKPLPLRPVGGGSKHACGLRAQAPLFPGSAGLRKGDGGLLRALPPCPAFACAGPVPSAPPERRAALRPVSIRPFMGRKAAAARLPFPVPPFAPAPAPVASGACKRLPAARPLVQGPAPTAVALNPGEAIGLSAGQNA